MKIAFANYGRLATVATRSICIEDKPDIAIAGSL